MSSRDGYVRREAAEAADDTESYEPRALRLRGAQAPAKRSWRRHPIRWGAAALVAGVVLYFGISYADYTLRPTSETLAERSAEWVRDDVPFGNWMIDTAENATASAPVRGGPGLRRLPTVGLGTVTVPNPVVRHRAARTARVYEPPAIRPVFATALAGEGVWRRAGPAVNGAPPVLVTSYRPSVEYPAIVADVLWIDHTRTDIGYYPGRYEPPSAIDRGPMMVPVDERGRLLATFNGGFTHVDTDNGSAVNGHTNEPLIDGNATLVGYRNGTVNLVRWTGGPDAPPDVAWARQSLTPILWDGQLNPELDTNPNSVQWGYSLGGKTFTPRTGVGIDSRGNVIFVVVSEATVVSLAQVLQHVGAVRGMEFDINPDWHTLITYSHEHGLGPTMVEDQPNQSADRYLTPDDRDFFAVYTPVPGPVTVPFS